MRDIEGENMWLGYITEGSLGGAFDDPGKNENWLHLVNAFLSAAYGKRDKEWALKYAAKMFEDYRTDELVDPEFVKNILRTEVRASEEEIEAATGGDVQGDERTGIEEADPVDGEKDYAYWENIPVEDLKQLSPEEAEEAIGKLNGIDQDIQKSTDRSFTDDENRRRSGIAHRIQILRDIITPPPPPPSREDIESRRAERKTELDKQTRARRNLQGLKKKWAEDGTWEKLGLGLPKLQSTTMFGDNKYGVGGVPPEMQRYIGMDYLLTGEMPSPEEIRELMKMAIQTREVEEVGEQEPWPEPNA